MTATTARPVLINATGAARRLQAAACAGYGTGHLAELLVANRMHVRAWQQHRRAQIHLATHQRIAHTYERIWDTDGRSTLARQHAIRRGWHPFEAWTDSTIDDPGAPPYSDPEQTGYVDQVLLQRVTRGERAYLDLSAAEKLELLRLHLETGTSLRGFRNRYRPVPKRELDVLVSLHPDIWPLLKPDDLDSLTRREVRVADLRYAG